MCTFREGLLNATPATSSDISLIPALREVSCEDRPFSLFLPPVSSESCRIGLEGIGASLLGMGVMDAGALVNAVLDNVETGVFLTVAGVEGAGLGELVDFFWKNPRIDFWFFPDWEPDGGCFFWEGRGVDISLPSTPRAMIATVQQMGEGIKELTMATSKRNE
jgi:hypothetical protein